MDGGTEKRPGLKLVLVDSSPFGDEPGQVWAALKKDGLTHVENWLFADSFEERLRYEIDPRWRGEMPYTLLIGRDGKITAITGEMDFASSISGWISRQEKVRRQCETDVVLTIAEGERAMECFLTLVAVVMFTAPFAHGAMAQNIGTYWDPFFRSANLTP